MKTGRFHLALLIASVLAFAATASPNSITSSAACAGGRRQPAIQSPELHEADQLNQKMAKLYAQGKYTEALSMAYQILALRERALGPDHELVASTLRNISELLFATRKYKEAESTFQRALSIYEKAFGLEDSRLVPALDQYVCFLVNTNQKEKALDVEKRLYRIENRVDFDGTVDRKNGAAAGIMIGKTVTASEPKYSPQARQAGVSGSVVMKIDVDESGKVVKVKSLCGHSLLVKEAEEAVLRSRFKPTIISGQPKKVTGIIIYNFVTG